MKKIDLKIATPERVVYRNEAVDSITLPTQQGEITVLPGHIPLVSALQPGEVVVVHFGLQPGQLHAQAGLTGGDEALVADQSSDQADQDGRAVGPPCQKAGVPAI